MSEFQQIIRNPEYDGSSGEVEEIDHVDITHLISNMSVPIVTVPAEDKDGNEIVEDKDKDEDEDENDAPPGLETDESSSIGDEGSAIWETQQIQVEWRSEDQEDHSSWEPPSDLLPQEYQFPDTTVEGTLEQIQYQVKDLMKIIEQLENLRKYQTASSA